MIFMNNDNYDTFDIFHPFLADLYEESASCDHSGSNQIYHA